MSGRYLLDSNIIIALFADEVAIKDSLAKAEEVSSLALPSESYISARGNQSEQEIIWLASMNLQPITSFSDVIRTPPVDTAKSRPDYGSKGILSPKMTFGLLLSRSSMV
jgi:hypothetical protein